MLKQPIIEKMLALRLSGMVEALKTQEQDAASRELSFLERLGLLVDQQWNWRENQALGRPCQVLRGSNPCRRASPFQTQLETPNLLTPAWAGRVAPMRNIPNIFAPVAFFSSGKRDSSAPRAQPPG